MPPGSHIIAVKPWGTSSWSSGYKVDVINVDGEKSEYFLKARLITHDIYLPTNACCTVCMLNPS